MSPSCLTPSGLRCAPVVPCISACLSPNLRDGASILPVGMRFCTASNALHSVPKLHFPSLNPSDRARKDRLTGQKCLHAQLLFLLVVNGAIRRDAFTFTLSLEGGVITVCTRCSTGGAVLTLNSAFISSLLGTKIRYASIRTDQTSGSRMVQLRWSSDRRNGKSLLPLLSPIADH